MRRRLATKLENPEASTRAQDRRLPGAPVSDRATALSLALILGVVFLSYLDTMWFQFVHDDTYQILGNTWLRAWKYFPLYFTRDVWGFNHPAVRGTFYRPVFLVWFRLQYLMFGVHPWGWHLCTILCHVAVTLLVFFTALRLLEDRLGALFTTLIFGLHPIHADAVAWVSGVTESLYAIFLFASYLFYLKKRRDPGRAGGHLVASLVMYALASLSKETAVVLPFIIFTNEVIWSRTSSASWLRTGAGRCRDALKVVAPYLAVFAVYMVVRIIVLQGFQNTKENHSLLSMLLTWPEVLWFYIRHLVWPVRLTPFYVWDYCTRVDLRHVLLPALAVLAATAGLGWWAKRSVKAAIAVTWLVVPILPALDLRAFIEGHLVHDRYLYLPSFGFALLVAMAIRHINFRPEKLLGQPALQLGLVGVMGLAMAMEITQATACYANSTTFFTYVNAMMPEGHRSNLDLAVMLGQEGHLDEAIKIYEEIIKQYPNEYPVNYDLGYAFYLKGNLQDALPYLTHATQIDASRPDGFFYLGLTKLKLGDINGAAADVQRAVTIRPDADHYHFALGVIFRLQGNLPGALSEFRQELDLNPGSQPAREQVEEIEAAQTSSRKSAGKKSATEKDGPPAP